MCMCVFSCPIPVVSGYNKQIAIREVFWSFQFFSCIFADNEGMGEEENPYGIGIMYFA